MSWIPKFQDFIWQYYRSRRRTFFWRSHHDPYVILLSEIMLQQTQTSRIEQRLPIFLTEFPTLESLAHAPLQKVLHQWVGLGYNRRAINLHRTAQIVHANYGGQIPEDSKLLLDLPGIGPYTAGSIPTFAYNLPRVFVETNIRRVFIHHFTDPTQETIDDKYIFGLVEATLDTSNPREWYYGLMDYGAELKTLIINPNRRSKVYTKQSTFEGSNRQIRGAVLKICTQETRSIHWDQLHRQVNKQTKRIIPKHEFSMVLEDLRTEGFLCKESHGPWYRISS
jgi:A/G-specific adenine glycosylase